MRRTVSEPADMAEAENSRLLTAQRSEVALNAH